MAAFRLFAVKAAFPDTTTLRTLLLRCKPLPMDSHRRSRILLNAACIFLVLTACSKQSADKDKLIEHKKYYTVSSDNMVARASQGKSIVFPLSVDISEDLPNFTKIEVKGSKSIDAKQLIFAVYSCSFYETSWFDSTSHWKAIVTLSASSELLKDDYNHFSDAELIECVRKLYGRTFFYQVRNTGYDTTNYDTPWRDPS